MSETEKPVSLQGEAGEVALAEATAVLAMVQDEDRRGRLADLIAAIEDGAVQGESAQALEELLELGLQTGRLRALYGPAGEQARAGRWWWESGAPKECGIHCAIETGGFEHELHAILGEEEH